MALAHDLPATWNAPGTDARTKQRITHILISEVVIDLRRRDQRSDCHNPLEGRAPYRAARLARPNRALPGGAANQPGGGHPQARRPMARSRGGHHHEPDALQACRREGLDHGPCTGAARAARDRAFDPAAERAETVGADQAAKRLGICVGSVHKLIRERFSLPRSLRHPRLGRYRSPHSTLKPSGKAFAKSSIAVPKLPRSQQDKTLWLPGFERKDALCHPTSRGGRGSRTHDPRTGPVQARFAPAPPGCRSPCACRWRPPPATPACPPASRSSQQLNHLPQRLGRHLAANAHPRPASQGDLDRAAASRSRARLARVRRDRHRQHGDALFRPRRLFRCHLAPPFEQLVGVHVMTPGHNRHRSTRLQRLGHDPTLKRLGPLPTLGPAGSLRSVH